ncbi:MAG: GDP-mannose 4,6-dehydratase, partial [Peptococcaceae bacterium]|nr:GDP-mannose 4,6-dehydratase [Peptococcaceae bacterium]
MRNNSARLLITGGAGFIGSNLVKYAVKRGFNVLNYDKLTYAGSLLSLASLEGNENYAFVRGDIRDGTKLDEVFRSFAPDTVLHLAAESHVDRSIDAPSDFIGTNVLGTFSLLQAARKYHASLAAEDAPHFRFLHVSTDEVFGSLGPEGRFDENTPYSPRSPYSASKAASDHL